MTAEAFRNAIRVLMAIGGSTNAVVHLLAVAGRLGVPLTLDDFAAEQDIPVLANLRPSGEHLLDRFFYAGGVQALMAEMAPLLDREAMTVTGRTVGENLEGRRSLDHDVIRPSSDPISPSSAIAVLKGNLAPHGAVMKRSAADPALFTHYGPAFVFESVYELNAKLDDPDLAITSEHVIVLKGGGPVGAPGMPEWGHIPIPGKLVDQGVTDMVRISDSRISGGSHGAMVVHVSPEAAVGGPSRRCRPATWCGSTWLPVSSRWRSARRRWSSESPSGRRQSVITSAGTARSTSTRSSRLTVVRTSASCGRSRARSRPSSRSV